ncbi:MAG: hypothetical protein ACI4F7_03015, partial [Acutalibacteraceae bacterium]
MQDKIVYDPETMTIAEVSEGDGQVWGLPDGSKEKVQLDGKWVIKVTAGPSGGKAISPRIASELSDFSDAKAVDIEIKNDSGNMIKIAPYFFINDNTPYILKAGNNVTLITENGSEKQRLTENGTVYLPAGFDGVLRVPFTEDGSTFTQYWAGPDKFDLKKITRFNYEVSPNASFYLGTATLKYDIPTEVPEDKIVYDPETMSAAAVSEGDGQVWGLPDGSKEK